MGEKPRVLRFLASNRNTLRECILCSRGVCNKISTRVRLQYSLAMNAYKCVSQDYNATCETMFTFVIHMRGAKNSQCQIWTWPMHLQVNHKDYSC